MERMIEFIKDFSDKIEEFIRSVDRLKKYTDIEKQYLNELKNYYKDTQELQRIACLRKMGDNGVYYQDDYNVVYVKHDGMISKYHLMETIIDMERDENEIW